MAAAARACVGTPFRPQGRRPGVALDCAGVVAVALAAAGASEAGRPEYRLGGDDLAARASSGLAAAGLLPAAGARAGDVLVFALGGRPHLAVRTDGGRAVHAHAGLGRVVEAPIDPAWDLRAVWRLDRGE